VSGSLRVLVAMAVVVLLWLSEPTPWSVAAGLPFIALGLVFRVWASGHSAQESRARRERTVPPRAEPALLRAPVPAHRLRDHGLDPVGIGGLRRCPPTRSCCRLPRGLLRLLLPRKRRVEGSRLTKLHGEAYAAWARAVPEIIPRLRPYGINVRAWSAERFHDNSEGLFVLVVLGIVAAFAIRAVLGG
jgi:hypothetical protein